MAAMSLQCDVPDYAAQGEARGRPPQKASASDTGSRRRCKKGKGKAGKKSGKAKIRKGKMDKMARVAKVAESAASAGKAVETAVSEPDAVPKGKKSRKSKAGAAPQLHVEVSEEPKAKSRQKRKFSAKNGGEKRPKGGKLQDVAETKPKEIEELPLPDDEAAYYVPEDAYDAPATATTNKVYSCAYCRGKKIYAEKSEWQRHAKWATWVFRIHGKISPFLSGHVGSKKVPA